MIITPIQEQKIRKYFFWSVLIKGIISLAEVIVGTLAFFIPLSVVSDFITKITLGELTEEPTDWIANHLVTLGHQIANIGGVFVAVYLLSRGLVKLLLIIALLKNQLWAYPTSLFVIGTFVGYQVYQLFISLSPVIIILTIFDLVVMWSIWAEYKILKTHLTPFNQN